MQKLMCNEMVDLNERAGIRHRAGEIMTNWFDMIG